MVGELCIHMRLSGWGTTLMLADYFDFLTFSRIVPNHSADATNQYSELSPIPGRQIHPLKDGQQRSELSACNCIAAR